MDRHHAQQRIDQLRHDLERHNRLYYVEARPEISDYDYDQLMKELERLEREFPEFASPDSPTQRVGGEPLEGFVSAPHAVPMLSLANTYNAEEVEMFVRRVRERLPAGSQPAFVVEPKVDGVSISIRYEDGRLVQALTRGDGKVGDEVTANIRTIASVPLRLDTPRPPAVFEVRGEIFMTRQGFEKLNARRAAAGEEPFANARNATAGSLKLLDSRLVAQRPLEALFYGCGETTGLELESQHQLLETLRRFGLRTHPRTWTAGDFSGLWAAIEELDRLRPELPYETDGAVVKLDDIAQRETVGYTAKAPSWAMAYKYAAETAFTRLRDITVQVGRTGILTPVAELEPVPLCGSTISRATLHNEDEIRRRDIRIGDRVEIKKAGEVIPAVIGVDLEARPAGTEPFDLVRHLEGKCPCCGGPVVKDPEFVAWRCDNLQCPAQNTRRLRYFASRPALDLQMLGEVVANALVERGLVKEPLDLYDLKEEALAKLNLGTDNEPRMFGAPNARKLLAALETARQLPLARWLCALGIPEVGSVGAQDLAACHASLAELAESPILKRMQEFYQLQESRPSKRQDPDGWEKTTAALEGIAQEFAPQGLAARAKGKTREWLLSFGPALVKAVRDFFASELGRQTLKRLADLGISPAGGTAAGAQAREAGPLAGQSFVVTGTMEAMQRFEAAERIRALGGSVTDAVSSKTQALVVGAEPGSKKLEQAKKFGIRCLNEKEFLELLASAGTGTSAPATPKPPAAQEEKKTAYATQLELDL